MSLFREGVKSTDTVMSSVAARWKTLDMVVVLIEYTVFHLYPVQNIIFFLAVIISVNCLSFGPCQTLQL